MITFLAHDFYNIEKIIVFVVVSHFNITYINICIHTVDDD